jgi:hypothetical protein
VFVVSLGLPVLSHYFGRPRKHVPVPTTPVRDGPDD